MLSIILSACLIADPGQCREFKIQTDFQMPAKYCTMKAQPVVAQWSGEHPQWEIKAWSCQPSSLNDT
jgi:hypothetical protein